MPEKEYRLNTFEALLKDNESGVYCEFDDEFNQFGVFGSNSGFCYFLSSDQNEAKEKAEEINKKLKYLNDDRQSNT